MSTSGSYHQAGFGLVELILVMGIFAILASAAITSILGSFGINRLADQETEAAFYAQEGIEAVTSLRNRDWDNLATGTYGLATLNNLWTFQGSSDSNDIFTRSVTLTGVARDLSGNIVTSGGIYDADTWRIQSDVSWEPGPSRTNTVTLETYLSNYHKNWQDLAQFVAIDLPGNQFASKVQTVGNYVYAIRNGSPIDFVIVDITNIASPSLIGTLALDGVSENIAISGNYAYIASTSNMQELQVVDISNPSSPSLAGSLDLAANANMTGVYAVGTTVYMTRTQGGGMVREFYIIDASTPASPTVVGSLDLADTPNEVYVSGNFAYLASSSNSQELQVISIAVPAVPVQIGSLNLTGNDNATSIDGGSGFVVLGQLGTDLSIVDVTVPALPVLDATFDAGDNVNDVAVGHSDQNVFLATSNGTAEFQVVDITSRTSPTLLVSFDALLVHLGVGYNSSRDLAAAVGQSNDEEIVIYGPQ